MAGPDEHAWQGGCEICGGRTASWDLKGGGSLDRCGECGHLRRTLESAPANHRDAAYGGDPAMDRVRTALTHRGLCRGGPPTSVFEIGYGSGALLRRFYEGGARIAGVDPDQLGIGVDEVVRAHANLWQGTIEDVPAGAFAADLVTGVHVLEHVDDPIRTLERSASLLTPGGRVVFLTPAGDSWGPTTFGSAWWMLEDPTHVRFFTAASLGRAARRAGLSDIRVDRLVIDSLSVDVASTVRALRPPGPDGALASGRVRALALASAPAVAAARLLLPRTRATLRLSAMGGSA